MLLSHSYWKRFVGMSQPGWQKSNCEKEDCHFFSLSEHLDAFFHDLPDCDKTMWQPKTLTGWRRRTNTDWSDGQLGGRAASSGTKRLWFDSSYLKEWTFDVKIHLKEFKHTKVRLFSQKIIRIFQHNRLIWIQRFEAPYRSNIKKTWIKFFLKKEQTPYFDSEGSRRPSRLK